MDAQTLARWQFGITTVYHYFFVPVTIALSMLVAILQTFWYRSGNENYLRLTKFFGKLFLINFAMGVVTGIVQEFQFGMNWSEYSRFVGDIFGAPLALEALLAFFLESTFIGLWIFGWDRLPKKLHLISIYMAAIGTMVSAIFILAANSWMQNPVGAAYNPVTNRAEMSAGGDLGTLADGVAGFGQVLSNPVFLVTFAHTIAAAYMTAGAFVAAVSGWHLSKVTKAAAADANVDLDDEIDAWRKGVKLGAITLLLGGLAVMASGHTAGVVMTETQPMKMAAAEAHWDTNTDGPADFSVFTIGTLDGSEEVWSLRIPGVLSFLAGEETVKGIHDLEAEYREKGFVRGDGTQNPLQATYAENLKASYGDISVAPTVPISYWTFRLMIGMGMAAVGIALYLLWLLRRSSVPKPSKYWTLLMIGLPLLPLFANSVGWIFTEMGRQPWLVAGVMPTAMGVSPGVTVWEVAISMVLYTLIYGSLAVVEVGLLLKYIKLGLPDVVEPEIIEDEDAPLSFAY